MILKLSEAIRLGSMLKPQGFDDLVTPSSTCAMGAAIEACGEERMRILDGPTQTSTGRNTAMTPAGMKVFDTPKEWVLFLDSIESIHLCPVDEECNPFWEHKGTLYTGFTGLHIITHLNDDHRWTREAIADFVEQWENAQEQMLPEKCEANEPEVLPV